MRPVAATGDDIAFGLDNVGFTHTFATLKRQPGAEQRPDDDDRLQRAGRDRSRGQPLDGARAREQRRAGHQRYGQAGTDSVDDRRHMERFSPTFAYQWMDCNSSGTGCANIVGAIPVTTLDAPG